MIPNRLYKNGQQITLQGGGGSGDFAFNAISPSFSVSNLGIVSWSYNQSIGITNLSTTYNNNQSIGTVSRDTVRTQEISFRAPTGFANSGETVRGSLTATQLGVSVPDVTTLGASNESTTFATLNGRLDDNQGLPIFESGFYILERATERNNIITSGAYVFNSNSNISGNFSEIESGLTQNSRYGYVAFARNAAGYGYGNVVEFDTQEAVATAHYVFSGATSCTGGTASGGRLNEVVGDWEGAAQIQFDQGADQRPTSASCSSDLERCTITRTTTWRQQYVNGTRDVQRTCQIATPGSGTPRCSTPDNPLGATITAQESCNYIVNESSVETRSLPNDAFNDPRIQFEEANIVVTACFINQGGTSASVTTNFGRATVANLNAIGANNSADPRQITLIFNVEGEVPEGFDQQDGMETFSFTGLTTTCEQPGVDVADAPLFNAGSAQVTSPAEGTVRVRDGQTMEITEGTYRVTAPSGSGGIVTTGSNGIGAGNFNIQFGRSRTHTFQIANSVGTATYSITVAGEFGIGGQQ